MSLQVSHICSMVLHYLQNKRGVMLVVMGIVRKWKELLFESISVKCSTYMSAMMGKFCDDIYQSTFPKNDFFFEMCHVACRYCVCTSDFGTSQSVKTKENSKY
jgi:hypothetical protein